MPNINLPAPPVLRNTPPQETIPFWGGKQSIPSWTEVNTGINQAWNNLINAFSGAWRRYQTERYAATGLPMFRPANMTTAELPPYQLQNNIYPAPPRGTEPTTVAATGNNIPDTYQRLLERNQLAAVRSQGIGGTGGGGGGYNQMAGMPPFQRQFGNYGAYGYNVPMPASWAELQAGTAPTGFVESRFNRNLSGQPIGRLVPGQYSGYVPGENNRAGYYVGYDPRTGTRTPTTDWEKYLTREFGYLPDERTRWYMGW